MQVFTGCLCWVYEVCSSVHALRACFSLCACLILQPSESCVTFWWGSPPLLAAMHSSYSRKQNWIYRADNDLDDGMMKFRWPASPLQKSAFDRFHLKLTCQLWSLWMMLDESSHAWVLPLSLPAEHFEALIPAHVYICAYYVFYANNRPVCPV